ncbi:MAG: xanthine dehydrogenase family protein molybdopterin-binding subunit [Desulfomonile sp.]|nr:xanthine dehydrogenase family protein molybdopterin-binding subunit [Desulfomonile sp.]
MSLGVVRSQAIGTSIERRGTRARLRGDTHFAADLNIAGVVTAVVLRSDRPHALIREFDPAAAKSTPGYLGVFTWRDIPGRNRFGIINKDQELLVERKVRCVGDPVALVVAETEEAAQRALSKIRVVYEDLPAVFDPEEALTDAAPRIHEKGNLLGRRVVRRGSPEEALKHSDVVVERTYTTSFVEHAYLEPDAGLAYIDHNDILVVHASTQNPHYDQKDVADLLGLPEDRVRIIQEATGGGFGSKLDLNVQGFVGLAAFLVQRPVRMVYSREEAFLATAKRHPLKIRYKSGANRDGRLTAVDVTIIGDTGAYASYGLAVTSRAAVHATGPYEVPNVSVEAIFAYTNNPMAGAMRGFGVPQMAFAHESQMDLLAAELGLSPLEIRRRNALRIGSQTATGQYLTASVGIGATLDAVASRWEEARVEKQSTRAFVRRGVGIASMIYGIGNTGMQNPSTAQVELGRDGFVTLYSGAADIGQGSSTVLVQIAAEALGLKPDAIRSVIADTAHTTSAGATSASRQTYISGNAVLDAATKLHNVILTEAAMMLKADRGDLELRDGSVFLRSDPGKGVSFKDIAERASRTGLPLKWQGYFDPDTTPLDPETGQGRPYATYAFATHVAEVEVDSLSGEVRVLKVTAAHDVGRAINPLNVQGQIYSGVAMGLGLALMEEFHPGVTESLKDYHIATAADMPAVIPIIVEDPEPTGPFGAKGVGEPALIPTAPAIANAVADALSARVYNLPMNLERVLKAGISVRSAEKEKSCQGY